MQTEYSEEVARVIGTHIGVEDHGILSVNVDFGFGSELSSVQGTGHYGLDIPTKLSQYKETYNQARVGTAWGMEFIRRMMLALSVSRWEDAVGSVVYVLRLPTQRYGQIKGVRPLPVNGGKEFIFSDLDVLVDR